MAPSALAPPAGRQCAVRDSPRAPQAPSGSRPRLRHAEPRCGLPRAYRRVHPIAPQARTKSTRPRHALPAWRNCASTSCRTAGRINTSPSLSSRLVGRWNFGTNRSCASWTKSPKATSPIKVWSKREMGRHRTAPAHPETSVRWERCPARIPRSRVARGEGAGVGRGRVKPCRRGSLA